LKVQLDLFSKM